MSVARIDKNLFGLYCVYAMIIIGAMTLPSVVEMILCLLGGVYTAIEVWNGYVKDKVEICCYGVVFPIIISCFQNIYLGIAANKINKMEMQVLLSLHFLFVLTFIIISMVKGSVEYELKWLLYTIMFIVLVAGTMYIIKPAVITSFISSIRNLLSCMLFFYYTSILSKKLRVDKYYQVIGIVITIVVLFGFFEYFIGFDVWHKLNISKLWTLKSIKTNISGIPENWYSSERIGGIQLRRMVSSFADPVNLGTFLFAAAMVSFYRKKKIIFVLIIICCCLTISKGAILGLGIFGVIFSWYKDKSKLLSAIALLIGIILGVGFIEFSKTSSSGSLFAHIRGLTNSFNQLLEHPMGVGVGNSGVLANLFAVERLDSLVTETGIGSVIAQLGIVGMFTYLYFFVKLSEIPFKWGEQYNEEKIIYYSILFSFIVNALFNEVALSPNSCGLYFVELAVLNTSVERWKEIEKDGGIG